MTKNQDSTLFTVLTLLGLALLSFSLVACEKGESKSAPEPAPTKAQAEDPPAADTATQSLPPAGQLKGIMIGLGADMAVLQSGLWIEDFEIIATSAMKVADHPKVSDSEKERIIKTLGDDFGAFVAMDKAVHGGAVKLAEAAKKHHWPNVLNELTTLQGNCVTCHAQFRTRLSKKE